MAANISAVANHPQLLDKTDTQSEIWHYFAYTADSQGKPTNTTKPVCERCFKTTQTKGANVPTDMLTCIENSE